jgi:hypothetical protein
MCWFILWNHSSDNPRSVIAVGMTLGATSLARTPFAPYWQAM